MAGVRRIPFDELTPEVRQALDSKVSRLGYLGEFFQVSAHQPEALLHFIRFTDTLKDALPINLVELLALTLSTWSGNDYERVQHERLALKSGLSEAWVRAVERLAPDEAQGLDAKERATQRLALTVARSQGREARGDADRLLALTDETLLIGVMLTIGRYLAHSAICNTFGLQPPVPSPLGAEG
jgi:alkylhydroperoxidase family enzyme